MRNWRDIFGTPPPAMVAAASVSDGDLERILQAGFFSDTDLIFQPCNLIAVTEGDRIRTIAAAVLNSELLSSSPLLILVGIEKQQTRDDLARAVERIESETSAAGQYGRYKILSSDERAFDGWVIGTAARCAMRLTFAARALGYAAMVLEVFAPGNLGALISAPTGVEVPFLVAIGCPLVQRLGREGQSASARQVFSNTWGRESALPADNAADEPRYRDSLISYFDVLGFRGAIESWSPQRIETVLTQLLWLSSHDARLRRATSRGLSTFSDHVVRTTALGDLSDKDLSDTIEFELSQIQLIQANLAAKGIFLRGGVTRGLIYIDDELVFGPGLVRAYELENNVAKHPRVVVDENVVAGIAANARVEGDSVGRPYLHLLVQDDEGVWSTNYLLVGDDLRERLNFTKLHANILRKALTEPSEPKVIAKYRWLARLHNKVVAEIPDADLIAIGLGRDELVVFSPES
jgi:nitroreductase